MALKNIKWPNQSEGKDTNNSASVPTNSNSQKVKWRTIIGLGLIYIAVALNWQWIWGILSLYWVLPSFFTGVTYFIEPIERKENPILYWLIIITWVAFSIAMFFPSVS